MNEETTVVNEETQESVTETQVGEEETTTQPGEKTDPALLHKSLREERQRRQELEREKAQLEEQLNSSALSTGSSDEDVSGQIQKLQKQLTQLETESTRKELLAQHPVLQDKWDDFELYHNSPENKGMSLATAAKAYMVENDLVGTIRKPGLERATGGDKKPTQPAGSMTSEEAKQLRESNFRLYQEKLQKGQLIIQD